MTKNDNYQYRFRFNQNQLEYDFQIKKRRKWWWLLLLLLPLLLLVRCNHEVSVLALTTDNTPVENAVVESHYTEYQLFKNGKLFFSMEHTLTGCSDETGLVNFGIVPTSIWSWFFHTRTQFSSFAKKNCLEGNDTSLFHWHCHKKPYIVEMIDMCLDTTSISIHVVDMETGDDIPGASIRWRMDIDGSSITNEYGIFNIPISIGKRVVDFIDAKVDGYADTTYTSIPLPPNDDSIITIVMRPIDVAFNCDIVMCIDNTGSMSPLISSVKKNILHFYTDISNYCKKTDKEVGDIRMQIIDFGDFSDSPMHISEFYNLPDQSSDLGHWVSGINSTDGGDAPENALEALATAINTSWKIGKMRRRQVIIIYTDAPAHRLQENAHASFYPPDMPATFEELTAMWNEIEKQTKRLILFAPNSQPWTDISTSWSSVSHQKGKLTSVLGGSGYIEIVKIICESL